MPPRRTEGAALASVVTRFCRSNASFRLLDAHPATEGSTWSAGGCRVLAEALAQAFGWTRYGVTSDRRQHGRILEHVVVGRSGKYIDADGLSDVSQLLERWREREGLVDPRLVLLTECLTRGTDIPCPPEVVTMVAERLRRRASVAGPQPRLARRRNGEDAALPEWILDEEIDDPLAAFEDEEGDVPDEETLMALIRLQQRRKPGTTYSKNTYRTGKQLCAVSEPDRLGRFADDPVVWVYDRDDKDGHWSRYSGEDFMQRLSMYDRFWEYLGDDDEIFNEEFWESPSRVFHGTTDLEGVLRDGLRADSQSRGMTNQSVGSAVFATTEEEVASSYAHGRGGGIVVIDTVAMKENGFMPRVTREPGIVEQEQSDAMASSLGIQWLHEECNSDGVTPDTIIFHRSIPKKYLKQYRP